MKLVTMMSFSRPTIAQPAFCSFQRASSSCELLVVLLGQREFIFAAYVFSKCQSAFFAETRTFQTVSHSFRLHRIVARSSAACTITLKPGRCTQNPAQNIILQVAQRVHLRNALSRTPTRLTDQHVQPKMKFRV